MNIMDKQKVRSLAIELLDNENGINEAAYDILRDMLVETENEDVVNAVEATDGAFYIYEEDAEDLRKV